MSDWKWTSWYLIVATTIILLLSVHFALTRADRQVIVDCASYLIVCENIAEDGDDEVKD